MGHPSRQETLDGPKPCSACKLARRVMGSLVPRFDRHGVLYRDSIVPPRVSNETLYFDFPSTTEDSLFKAEVSHFGLKPCSLCHLREV